MHSGHDVEYAPPQLVSYFFSLALTALYGQIVVSALLLYDSIITLDKEVKYFWSAPRKSVSLVYFLNRYIGLSASLGTIALYTFHVNERLCLYTGWICSLADWLTILLLDYILLIRVEALHINNKGIAKFLRFLFALDAASSLGLLLYSNLSQRLVVEVLAEGFTICASDTGVPPVFGALPWFPPLVYGIILMCFALHKAIDYWKTPSRFRGSCLVTILIQDQVLYFVLVTFCTTISIVSFWVTKNGQLPYILEVFGSPCILCLTGSRLLIHMKEAGEKRLSDGNSYGMRTFHTGIEFADTEVMPS